MSRTGSTERASGRWPDVTSWDPTLPQKRPVLTGARVVVGAGRGIGEDISAAEELADVLGAAVGATRALVDEGIAPRALQIGQTGVSVSPEIYIAVGVSGATQHMSGVIGPESIIGINEDPDAPIHALADLSVVGDATVILPRLIDILRSGQGGGENTSK